MPLTLSVTPFYAAALTTLYIFLSIRVIAFRRSNRVSLGDGGQPVLLARIRAHANCAEYAPLGLLLLLIAELSGADPALLHLAGLLLLAGRILHPWALAGPNRFMARTAGMGMTFTALALSAGLALL